MTARLVFAAASRARPPALQVANALKAPAARSYPHTSHPYRGTVHALISSSACSRTSTRETSQAPSPAAAGSPSVAAIPESAAQGTQSATTGTASAGGGAEGSSAAAANPSTRTSSDPPTSGSGSGGGGDGGRRGPLTWGAVGLLGIVATLAVGYYKMKWEEKQNRTVSEVRF